MRRDHDDAHPGSRRTHGRPHRRDGRRPPPRRGEFGRASPAGRGGPCQPRRHLSCSGRKRWRGEDCRCVTRAGAIVWFAQHEARLAWRDLLWLMSAGGRRPGFGVALGVVGVALVLHGFAYLMFFRADLASPPDRRMLVLLTGVLALNGSLMLSQAMELVTRGFYGRGDLDLILSSPVAAWRLFAVRIGAMAVTIDR